jgi:gamma-glutamyltranspeptidase/glutathione hydrolase
LDQPADLDGYRLHWREPVQGTYRGAEIASMRPASSGGIHVCRSSTCSRASTCGGWGSARWPPPTCSSKPSSGLRDRTRFLADPETTDVPVAWLASPAYATSRRGDLDLARASRFSAGEAPRLAGEGDCTTHVTVADGAGGIVTTTQTINSLFGSRVTVPGTGLFPQQLHVPHGPRAGADQLGGPGQAGAVVDVAHHRQPRRAAVVRSGHAGRQPHLRRG